MVWNMTFIFHFIHGMSSETHWRTPSFFRGVGQPPTSNKKSIISIIHLCQLQDLKGLSVLDLGCGSGLSSLAFRLLGASPVTSVDLQPASLEATRQLHGLFEVTPALTPAWRVAQASALEAKSLAATRWRVGMMFPAGSEKWGKLWENPDFWENLRIRFHLRLKSW